MTRVAYSPEIIEKVCELLHSGMSLRAIGKLEGMPNRATLWKWAEKHEGVAAAIAHARQLGWDELAERALEEAETAPDPAKGKLALDARRWFLAKMDPDRYGDRQRIQSEISGPDGRPVQLHAIVDEGEAAQRLHAILQTAQARVEAARQLTLTDQRTDADDLA